MDSPDAGARRSRQAPHVLLLAALVMVAAALRFYQLGRRSLWLDEIYTGFTATLPTPGRVLYFLSFYTDQAPWQFEQSWLLGFLGQGETALRLPYAVAGTLAILALYFLAAELYSRRVGLFASGLVAIIPFAVWYSQEARVYALLLLVVPLQMLLAHRVATRARARDWLALALLSTAALYIHMLCALTTAAAFLYAVLLSQRLPGRFGPTVMTAVQAGLLILVLYLPWLPHLASFVRVNSGEDLGRVRGAYDTLPRLAELLGVLGFGWFGIALMATGLVAVWRRPRPGLVLLACWLGVPLCVLTIASHGLLLDVWPRYFIPVWPALALLAALGADTAVAAAGRINWRPAPSLAAGLIAAALVAQAAPSLARAYTFEKDQWREAAALVETSGSRPLVITMGVASDWETQFSLDFYLRRDGSRAVVLDGRSLPADPSQVIGSGDGPVWAAVANGDDPSGIRRWDFIATPPPEAPFTDLRGVSTEGFVLHRLVGVTMIQLQAPTGGRRVQAAALLGWGGQFQPGLRDRAAALMRSDSILAQSGAGDAGAPSGAPG